MKVLRPLNLLGQRYLLGYTSSSPCSSQFPACTPLSYSGGLFSSAVSLAVNSSGFKLNVVAQPQTPYTLVWSSNTLEMFLHARVSYSSESAPEAGACLQWMCFDACPLPACLPYSAERIAAVTPHAKLIFMVIFYSLCHPRGDCKPNSVASLIFAAVTIPTLLMVEIHAWLSPSSFC